MERDPIPFDFILKMQMAYAVNQWLHDLKAKGKDVNTYCGMYLNRVHDIKEVLEIGIAKTVEIISNFTDEEKALITNLPEELKCLIPMKHL